MQTDDADSLRRLGTKQDAAKIGFMDLPGGQSANLEIEKDQCANLRSRIAQ